MKTTRRDLLRWLGLSALAAPSLAGAAERGGESPVLPSAKVDAPLVVSTWEPSDRANAEAAKLLAKGSTALDSIEEGVSVGELDPDVELTGIGALPDSSGEVTLDASIMDHRGECGAVACLPGIATPIRVARRVMQDTPHVLLVGDRAETFALKKGFQRQNLLTDAARKTWEEKRAAMQAEAAQISHDTLGMLALDRFGDLAGGCSTGGWFYKIPGRVGDSPLIGAGLYVDGEVGGAVSTGDGEQVIKVSGSFAIVEGMRRGVAPQDAIAEVLCRVAKRNESKPMQVCFLALRRDGAVAAMSLCRSFPLHYVERRVGADGEVQVSVKTAPYLLEV